MEAQEKGDEGLFAVQLDVGVRTHATRLFDPITKYSILLQDPAHRLVKSVGGLSTIMTLARAKSVWFLSGSQHRAGKKGSDVCERKEKAL